MHTRHTSLLMAAAMTGLLLVGAGCATTGDEVALSPNQANSESVLAAPNADQFRQNAQEFKAAQDAPPSQAMSDTANAQGETTPHEDAPADTAPNSPEPAAKHMAPTSFPGILSADRIHGKQVRLETNKGTIVFELYDGDAPKTVSNFVALAESGFYDGLTFHRVVPGFVIQGGDPLGTGTGGPGYKFEDEPVTRDYDQGIVAMANAGPNTNGSQFFIMLEDNPLPKQYTIFGKVLSGMDVVHAIVKGDKMTKVTVEAKK